MSENAKIWLVTAFFLVLIGCIIFWGIMSMLEWDFTKLSTSKYETNNHVINEKFKSITVDTNTADIDFVLSEDTKTSVICYEQQNERHSVGVKDGTLLIEVVDTRKWYEYIGINFSVPKITVYIPRGEYETLSVKSDTGDVEIPKDFKFKNIHISGSTGDVTNYAFFSERIKIKTSTGNICVKNISSGTLDLSVSTGNVTVSEVTCEDNITVNVSTGKVKLSDIACKSIISSGSTGDILLNNVIAKEKFSIERSTGDVKFDGCDASEIFVETDTGDVKGSLLSEKVFIVNTDTGKKDVPDTITGGRCEITTDTGDIKITIG